MKCAYCNHNLTAHQPVCDYCGANNPEYRPQETEVNTLRKQRQAFDQSGLGSEINMLLEQGQAEYAAEHYAAAIDCYTRVLTLAPQEFAVYFYLAASYSALKRHEEAIRVMERALPLQPNNAPIYYNLGMLHKQIGHSSEARRYFEKALRLAKKESAFKNNQDFIKSIREALKEYKRWKIF